MIPVQHIHPMLVHFPIVLILFLTAFDVIATLRGRSVTGRTVVGNISTSFAVLTGLFAIATYIFGGMALNVAEAGGFHSEVAEIHESLGEIVAIVTAVYALLRAVLWFRDFRINGIASFAFPIAGLAGSALVAVTAYFGGQLVYELGVNVAKVAMN
jgi:uncharacterized membrane protein